MIKIPTPEELINDDTFGLTWECILEIRKYFNMYKQKKCIISVDIRPYADETVDIVIQKLNNSGWIAERKVYDEALYLIIKDKRDIL
jgi:hypothetical protein